MNVEVPDEATCGADRGPSETAGAVIVVVFFPREFGTSQSVAGPVADIDEALECTEGDFAVRSAWEGEMRLLDEVEGWRGLNGLKAMRGSRCLPSLFNRQRDLPPGRDGVAARLVVTCGIEMLSMEMEDIGDLVTIRRGPHVFLSCL